MKHALHALIFIALSSCSAITSVDDLKFSETALSTDTNDPAGVGDVCSQSADCAEDLDCPKLVDSFTGQALEIESYCYPSCARNAGVCTGTGLPKCFAADVCLGTLAATGDLVCKTKGDGGIGESEVNLVVGTEASPTVLRTCELQNGASNSVTLTLSAAVQGKLRQIILQGEAAHLGESEDFEGYVYDVLLDNQQEAKDVQLVGFFESVSITTRAVGDIFRGSIDITGYAYSAKLDPSELP
ncbi:MAG: hypothetical protein MUC50_16480 [Myxococcota bacterium]|jgi:hypothetical protein|nr:hypothetical protein [Myxococcota bacterium]